LPAVITPPGSAGLMPLMPSLVVPSRRPSSLLIVTSLVMQAHHRVGDAGLHGHRRDLVVELAGGLSAAQAFCWLAAPYSSMRSRLML
jgi:hypothetical protein